MDMSIKIEKDGDKLEVDKMKFQMSEEDRLYTITFAKYN